MNEVDRARRARERGDARTWRERALDAEAALREALAENERLREALAEDPAKWSFWTLVEIARLILEADYPPDVFTGASGDPGPVFLARLREALAVLAVSPPEDEEKP